jgi:glutamate/tyrosine decarboxylase-like PLP-dependent enzyme
MYLKKQINLAKYFEKLVNSDERFEIIYEVMMGLVCFRLKVF